MDELTTELEKLTEPLMKTDYGRYLLDLRQENKKIDCKYKKIYNGYI